MSLLLSWKDKLRLLIVAILIGLGLMTASSLWTNQQLTASLQARQRASDYGNAATSLLSNWLKLEALRRELSPGTLERLERQLDTLDQQAQGFPGRAGGLDDPALQESARQIGRQVQENVGDQRQWLALRRQFGLTDGEGQRKAAADASAPLAPITISLIRPYIDDALNSQRDYLASLDPAYSPKVKAAVDKLKEQIVSLDWQDSQIGQATDAFAKTFSETDALILKIHDLQSRLAQQGARIEQAIETQDTALHDGILARTQAQAERTQHLSYWVIGAAFAAVAVLLLVVLTQVSRVLITQLDRVIQQLSQVAAGNLTAKLAIGRNPRDEFNRLGDGSNRMTQSIAGLIREVVEGNRALAELRGYLNDAMRHLEENSAQVEIQTEQAASASQQISATVTDMAQRANEVGSATERANQSARTGAKVIVSSVQSIRQLAQLIQDTHAQVARLIQSSGRVSGIIDTINALADQTNLLALNAAIEAARAGEAGRGFSVVADEVRSLAQKTVAATTDIAHIIQELDQQTRSMDQLMVSGLAVASEGERQAGEAAQAVDEITRSVDQLSAQMNQVVVAIEEISATTEDIAGKMEDIHRHTGETRDLRQTLDRHAHDLSTQVERLSLSTQQFQIG